MLHMQTLIKERFFCRMHRSLVSALQVFEILTSHEYIGGTIESTKNVFEMKNFLKSQNIK